MIFFKETALDFVPQCLLLYSSKYEVTDLSIDKLKQQIQDEELQISFHLSGEALKPRLVQVEVTIIKCFKKHYDDFEQRLENGISLSVNQDNPEQKKESNIKLIVVGVTVFTLVIVSIIFGVWRQRSLGLYIADQSSNDRSKDKGMTARYISSGDKERYISQSDSSDRISDDRVSSFFDDDSTEQCLYISSSKCEVSTITGCTHFLQEENNRRELMFPKQITNPMHLVRVHFAHQT